MSVGDRVILHSDLNNFYASVEGLLNPRLQTVPVAVCGDPAKRHGIVLAKNMLAKAKGVKTGDTVWEAQRKCPGLVCAAPHFDLYAKYSERVFNLYVRFTPNVEPFGNDECWLDATGSKKLFGGGPQIAEKIRETVKAETGLTVSVGVSFNKVFAKMGSDLKKPNAVTVITREDFKKILWPLPAGDMPGAGRKTAERLAKIGVLTVGDLAAADEKVLRDLFGVAGPELKRAANGLDTSPVRPYNEKRTVKSVGHGTTCAHDLTSDEEIQNTLYLLGDMVGARLRRYGLKALSVSVYMRTSDFIDTSRRAALPRPTSNGGELARAAFALVKAERPGPLRMLTVSAFSLITDKDDEQLSLFDTAISDKERRFDTALDTVRSKYGSNAVVRGASLYNDYAADRFDDEEAGFLPFKR